MGYLETFYAVEGVALVALWAWGLLWLGQEGSCYVDQAVTLVLHAGAQITVFLKGCKLLVFFQFGLVDLWQIYVDF